MLRYDGGRQRRAFGIQITTYGEYTALPQLVCFAHRAAVCTDQIEPVPALPHFVPTVPTAYAVRCVCIVDRSHAVSCVRPSCDLLAETHSNTWTLPLSSMSSSSRPTSRTCRTRVPSRLEGGAADGSADALEPPVAVPHA